MFKRSGVALLMLGVPRLVHAGDLGPLADLGPIANGIIAFMFLIAAIIVMVLGVRAFNSYQNRDLGGGMGEVMVNIGVTIMAGIVLGVIVVSLIAPLRALGATP